MRNRALIGLSAACMSALVITAMGCGQPMQKQYSSESASSTDSASSETSAAAESAASSADSAAASADGAASSAASSNDGVTASTDFIPTAAADSSAAVEVVAPEYSELMDSENSFVPTSSVADSEEIQAKNAAAGELTDGTYEATGKGIGGDVPVTVTITDGKISAVEVGDNSETQGIGSKAIEQLPALIVEANGIDGVDAVSGATVTSKAIFSAVTEALEDAANNTVRATAEMTAASPQPDPSDASLMGDAASSSSDKATATAAATATADKKDSSAASASSAADSAKADSSASLKDGTYEATGKGIGGDVPVTVTITDGKISAVEVGDNSETQGIGSKAIEQLPALIVEANGIDGVDAVSGATVTSKAIFSAVTEALANAGASDSAKADSSKADSSASLKDGSYSASAKGIGGDVPVTVTIKDGKISAVEVGDNSETQGIGSKAIEQLPALIVEANGIDGVDAVSGATVTSKAIFKAVTEALEAAAQ